MMLRIGMFVLLLCAYSSRALAACADGYIADDAGQCVATCAPGYYVAAVGAPCTKITGLTSFYTDASHVVKYGETSGDNVKQCPRGADICQNVYIPSSLSHSSITDCLCRRDNMRYTLSYVGGYGWLANWNVTVTLSTHGTGSQPCYYTTGSDGNAIYDNRTRDPVTGQSRGSCVGGSDLQSCDAGYWAEVQETGDRLQHLACTPVGAGYYSPDGDMERYACPDGTATCGYGDCAASVTDCVSYKTLKISGDFPDIMLIGREHPGARLHLRMPDGALYHGFVADGARAGHIAIRGSDGAIMSVVNPLEQFEVMVFESGYLPGTFHAWLIP